MTHTQHWSLHKLFQEASKQHLCTGGGAWLDSSPVLRSSHTKVSDSGMVRRRPQYCWDVWARRLLQGREERRNNPAAPSPLTLSAGSHTLRGGKDRSLTASAVNGTTATTLLSCSQPSHRHQPTSHTILPLPRLRRH